MQIIKRFSSQLNSIVLVVIGYVVFVSCSKEEPQPEPPKLLPEITVITPKGGFVGMHVIIEGKNFSKVLEENIVKIAGVNASVVDADENSIEVIVPAGGATGPVTVFANDETATGPSFRYYDLYLLGNQTVGNMNRIRFWRSGIVTDISDQTKYCYGTSFVMSGDDVFISGYEFDGQTTTTPAYWKNTQVHSLSTASGVATDISVDANDTYVSGIEYNGTNWIARYWKNGADVKLTEEIQASDASSIDVVDGNVFVGGSVLTSSTTSMATFWKNGAKEPMEEPLESSGIIDFEVAGQDVHLVGTRIQDSKAYITYWKNGVAKDITNGVFAAAPTSISVIEGDVYITGYENDIDGKSHGKVWNVTKDQIINVTAGGTYSIAMGVAKIDDMLVICGQSSSAQAQGPFYMVNGEFYPITELGSDVAIYGIFVK
jgi:hypothetical protein